jgi:hypothetical protein
MPYDDTPSHAPCKLAARIARDTGLALADAAAVARHYRDEGLAYDDTATGKIRVARSALDPRAMLHARELIVRAH